MTTKHTVKTDALETLGMIIDNTQKRDAIHLAVEPILALEKLKPGEHVALGDGGACKTGEKVGIVDPFLTKPVKQGEMFWLVVYPRTITSLRHEWSHPAFAEAAKPVEKCSVEFAKELLKAESEQWMRAWAMEHMGTDYYGDDTPLSEDEAFANAIEAGSRNHVGPYESAAEVIDNTWWNHWENITGVSGNRGGYFSCSC